MQTENDGGIIVVSVAAAAGDNNNDNDDIASINTMHEQLTFKLLEIDCIVTDRP